MWTRIKTTFMNALGFWTMYQIGRQGVSPYKEYWDNFKEENELLSQPRPVREHTDGEDTVSQVIRAQHQRRLKAGLATLDSNDTWKDRRYVD